MGIGRRIRQLRERRGLTQEELAERIGVTPSAVGNYEREVSHPREDVLYRLFGALCTEPNELFSDCFCASSEYGEHLEKYRALDEEGKKAVDECTERELLRMEETDGLKLIAARGNGAPHITELKKRGAQSIFDRPDYKGGRR